MLNTADCSERAVDIIYSPTMQATKKVEELLTGRKEKLGGGEGAPERLYNKKTTRHFAFLFTKFKDKVTVNLPLTLNFVQFSVTKYVFCINYQKVKCKG